MNKQDYLELIQPAIDIVQKKHQDYNKGIELSQYFPFGEFSYVQMIHVKSLRLNSLAGRGTPHFESQFDTLLDLINYCVFYLDYIKKAKNE